MYKKLLYTLLLLLSLNGLAQNFVEVDRKVLAYPQFASLQDLGIRIQNDFPEDISRVRAAFIWLTHNIGYAAYRDREEPAADRISYSSEAERLEGIDALVWAKINRAFEKRQGVCIDYSLMLNALMEQFALPSKIITGIVKTEVKAIAEAPHYLNHSWNAVQLEGRWKLMDATWAAGFVDSKTRQFVPSFQEHYFFTDPADFALHHLPANLKWQLLDHPVDAHTFFSAPLLLPDFCEKGIALSSRTSGTLILSGDRVNFIYFDALPSQHLMQYTIDDSGEFKRIGFRKDGKNHYVSKIKLRKRFRRDYEYLTIYMNEEPILKFKIKEVLN